MWNDWDANVVIIKYKVNTSLNWLSWTNAAFSNILVINLLITRFILGGMRVDLSRGCSAVRVVGGRRCRGGNRVAGLVVGRSRVGSWRRGLTCRRSICHVTLVARLWWAGWRCRGRRLSPNLRRRQGWRLNRGIGLVAGRVVGFHLLLLGARVAGVRAAVEIVLLVAVGTWVGRRRWLGDYRRRRECRLGGSSWWVRRWLARVVEVALRRWRGYWRRLVGNRRLEECRGGGVPRVWNSRDCRLVGMTASTWGVQGRGLSRRVGGGLLAWSKTRLVASLWRVERGRLMTRLAGVEGLLVRGQARHTLLVNLRTSTLK